MKTKLFLSFAFITQCIFSQSNFENEHSIIHLQTDVCKYHVSTEPNKSTVPRSSQLQARMNNNTPCSTFIVNYNGFTQQAQTAFDYAVSIWESSLDSPVPVRVQANFTSMPANQVGMATPSGYIALGGQGIQPNTIFPLALAENILGYEITQAGQPSTDISAVFNSDANFYFGTDGNPGINQIDFVTVVLHELAHGLGFVGLANLVNNGTQGAIRYAGTYITMYDSFVENGSATSILSFPDPSNDLLVQFTSDNLFCNSPEATNQNAGTKPKIFAPASFQQASSYNHWNETTFAPGNPNSLMTAGIAPGEAIHNPGLITLGLMQDMGWSICGSLLSNEDFTVNKVKVFPNPFDSELTIKLPESLTEKYTVEILNFLGQKVFSKELNNNNYNEIKNLDFLEKGIYVLQIKMENTGVYLSQKIFKN